jgi:hypothetical protein
MIAANKLGLKVVVVADATESKNANQAAMIKALTQAGVDVRLVVRQTALMNNKVGIFDGHTVCTGSFKWMTNAENHSDGNLLVVDGPI